MRALTVGRLDKFVRLRKWEDVPTGMSGLQQNYDDGIDRWAEILPVGAMTHYGAKQVGVEITHRISFRAEAGTQVHEITAEHVIEHAGRRYRVLRCTDVEGAGRFTAVEVTDLGAIA